jgi:small GTP-binding protein
MDRTRDVPSHKVVVIGDSSVGKTSIIHVFDEQTFDPTFHSTVGASFLSRSLQTGTGKLVLNIWDTAGQERYRSLIPTYAHDAGAALLVFDMTSEPSFANLADWLEYLRQFCLPDCALFVVGNKTDLSRQIPMHAVKTWANEQKAHCYFTSALKGTGITELFRCLIDVLSAIGATQSSRPLSETPTSKACCS